MIGNAILATVGVVIGLVLLVVAIRLGVRLLSGVRAGWGCFWGWFRGARCGYGVWREGNWTAGPCDRWAGHFGNHQYSETRQGETHRIAFYGDAGCSVSWRVD